jgi:hypothetical protein
MKLQPRGPAEFPSEKTRRTQRLIRCGLAGTIVAGAGLAMMGGVASAIPATSGESTTATVGVLPFISLTGLTDGFTLTGLPGETPSTTDVDGGAVTFNVATNNIAGYSVTVLSEQAALTPPIANVTNADTIPIGALSVRASGDGDYTPVSANALEAVTVHSQGTKSGPDGDALSNDYQVVIPFVNADTYTATLDYVATAS